MQFHITEIYTYLDLSVIRTKSDLVTIKKYDYFLILMHHWSLHNWVALHQWKLQLFKSACDSWGFIFSHFVCSQEYRVCIWSVFIYLFLYSLKFAFHLWLQQRFHFWLVYQQDHMCLLARVSLKCRCTGKTTEIHRISTLQASILSQNFPKYLVGTKHCNGKSHVAC